MPGESKPTLDRNQVFVSANPDLWPRYTIDDVVESARKKTRLSYPPKEIFRSGGYRLVCYHAHSAELKEVEGSLDIKKPFYDKESYIAIIGLKHDHRSIG